MVVVRLAIPSTWRTRKVAFDFAVPASGIHEQEAFLSRLPGAERIPGATDPIPSGKFEGAFVQWRMTINASPSCAEIALEISTRLASPKTAKRRPPLKSRRASVRLSSVRTPPPSSPRVWHAPPLRVLVVVAASLQLNTMPAERTRRARQHRQSNTVNRRSDHVADENTVTAPQVDASHAESLHGTLRRCLGLYNGPLSLPPAAPPVPVAPQGAPA